MYKYLIYNETMNTKKIEPNIGISSCLLGHKVRYDGGHKNNKFIADTLENFFTFDSFCHEVGSGMGIPRPPIQLKNINDKISLVDKNFPDIELQDKISNYYLSISNNIEHNLNGYILKSKSPSCGMERVPLYNENPNCTPNYSGVGIFAKDLIKNNPDIPIEEEGRLNDAKIRENFLERVYAHFRFQCIKENMKIAQLLEFHASYKFSIMARGSQYTSILGKIAASATTANIHDIKELYLIEFMKVMKIKATRNKHINSMQHIMGYFKNELDSDSKHELLNVFDSYKNNEVPLSTPMALLNLFQRKYKNPYIAKQYYLNPYPQALALRANI